MFLNGFLLGFLIISPVSGFAVVSSPPTEPVKVNIIKPGNFYIDIAVQSWQKDNNGPSSNTHRLFINDYGAINLRNHFNDGNTFDSPFDQNFNGLNIIPDERYPVSTVPEPTTLLLLGLGSLGLAAYRRKR